MKKWISKASIVLVMGNVMMPSVYAQSNQEQSVKTELQTAETVVANDHVVAKDNNEAIEYISSSALASTEQTAEGVRLYIEQLTPHESVQQVQAVVWTRPDRSDAQTYIAVEKNGRYEVEMDMKLFDQSANEFVAEWSITHANGTTDRLELYSFEKEKDQSATLLETATAPHSDDQGEQVIVPHFSPKREEPQAEPMITQQVDATQTHPSGNVTIKNVNAAAGTFDVVISNIKAPAGLKEVLVPVWAEENGQNDLRWYQATKQSDGTYTVSVIVTNHQNEFGRYHVHAYVKQQDSTTHNIATTTTQLVKDSSKPVISFKNQDDQNGTVDVVISNVRHAKGVEQVLVPIWADTNGQDDLIWYTATKQSDGTYRVSLNSDHHKQQTGQYHVHVYYRLQDKSQVSVANESVTIKRIQKPAATIAIEKINQQTESFEVVVSNVYAPTEIKQVLVPVWSEVNGQNDLRWYVATKQANNTYKVIVKVADHQAEFGKYIAHAYINGNQFAGETTAVIQQAQPTGKVSVVNSSSVTGAFDIVVSNVQSRVGVREILVPVWSTKNGQDDLRWYTAVKQANGTYKVSVDVSDHHFDTGTYAAHVYYKLTNSEQVGVTSLQHAVQITNTTPQANVAIENRNDTYGSFEVVIDKIFAPKGIKTIKVPVWSTKNGQNDLVWYTAVQRGDGKFIVNVDVKKHQYETGDYNVHVYVKQQDGSQAFAKATTVNNLKWVTYRETKTVYLDAGHGKQDSGAVANGLQEKDLNLLVSNKVKARLEAAGYQVVTTRTTDTYTDYRVEVGKKANASNADVFVSIHFNAGGGPNARGIETFYYEYDPSIASKINETMHNNPVRIERSKALADLMQSNLIAATNAVNRKVKRESFAVLRETAIPAVLLELGFVDNAQEAAIIKTDAYQNKLADAIVKSLVRYYQIY